MDTADLGSDESSEEREIFLRKFLVLTLGHLASFKVGSEEQNKNISEIAALLKEAFSLNTLQGVRNKYRELITHIDEPHLEEEKEKKGGLFGSFFKGAEKSPVELIDPKDEILNNLEGTAAAFAKGTLLLLDDEHPLEKKLSLLKSKEHGSIPTPDFERLGGDILTFFVSKSNEASVITRERIELKELIATLTTEMSTLSVSSEAYDDRLSVYAKNIGETDSISEILEVKQKILKETKEIQKENQKVKRSIKETSNLLNESSKKIIFLEGELIKARMEMMKDQLTKLYNRRAFDEKIVDQFNRLTRYNEFFSLIIFDLDHFKKINDTYGHVAGDIVLKTVASIARESVRKVDFIARYGGEEFVVLVEKAHAEVGMKIAEKIRNNIGSHEFIYKKRQVDVKVSLGVTVCREGDTPEIITERADSALYKAKENGRNQTFSE